MSKLSVAFLDLCGPDIAPLGALFFVVCVALARAAISNRYIRTAETATHCLPDRTSGVIWHPGHSAHQSFVAAFIPNLSVRLRLTCGCEAILVVESVSVCADSGVAFRALCLGGPDF